MRSCEEIRELAVPLLHGGYYEVRPPGLDGTGEISLRDLVKFVLAMRPDRIVVGEVRGAEAFELTRAVNAGCGFLCTVHANSARDAVERAGERGARWRGRTSPNGSCARSSSRRSISSSTSTATTSAVGRRMRRQVTEITAVVPGLTDGRDVRADLRARSGSVPLEWTGVLPGTLEARVDRVLPAACAAAT